MMETTQFSIKYRPRKWEDVFGQPSIVKALQKRIKDNNLPKATLFVGPYGTGKTTMAEILAAAMQSSLPDGNPDWDNPSCKSILNGTFDRDTQRLDGSQLSGKTDMVDFTRDLKMRPIYDKKKILIIEECDQLSTAAFNSLLKVLEDDVPYVHFILLSMEDKKGVPAAVKSRCQVFNVKSLSLKDTMMCLKHLMELENIWNDEKIPSDFRLSGLRAIAEAAKGSMRSAAQNLEKCLINEAYTLEEIDALLDEVCELSTWKILEGLVTKSKEDSLWRKIMNYKGDDVMHLYQYMIMLLSEAILCKETGFAYDDWAKNNLMRLGMNPEAERLFYVLTLHPQLNKPFLRNSDLIGALASYYQGLDCRPISMLNSLSINNSIQHMQEKNIVLGVKESNLTPTKLNGTENIRVRTRTRKTADKIVF